jgi:type IV pilus assembly protein PilA
MNTQYKQLQDSQRGFTIIEVVLVLAIAGLIFLMVFIALPALQRGQRDTGRKNDVSTVVSAVQSYASNNKGSIQNLTSANLRQYVDELSQYDKSTALVIDTGTGAGSVTASTDRIIVRKNAKCPTSTPAPGTLSGTLVAATANRRAAVVTALENGSSAQFYCQNF